MKFMLTFAWKVGMNTKTREEGIARFLKTGGKPGKGARLLGRWTRADFAGGFDLIGADDVKPLTEFALQWNDLMDLSIFPVADDEELGSVLKSMPKP
ncbi:DUF3303 family protein [bacterium]|nr:DUF3303 family protein [bacterium]